MQTITSSNQVAVNNRWNSYDICSLKDAYASSRNVISGVIRVAYTALANVVKTIGNAGIYVANKTYNLFHPRASVSPVASDVREVSAEVSVSIEHNKVEVEESALDEAQVTENELPEIEILEEPLELKASSNQWKTAHIAAATALGVGAGLTALYCCGVILPSYNGGGQYAGDYAGTSWTSKLGDWTWKPIANLFG